MIRLPAIPLFKEEHLSQYLRDLSRSLARGIDPKMEPTVGVSAIVLVSPGKKFYSVQVADDGTLSTTLVNE